MGSKTRSVLAAVGLVLAVVAIMQLGPTAPDTKAFTARAEAALTLGKLNEDSADSAVQQQVVNGWVARDLLAAQTEQRNALIEQQVRTNQLLFVGLLLAIGAVWSARRSPQDRPTGSLGDDPIIRFEPPAPTVPAPPSPSAEPSPTA